MNWSKLKNKMAFKTKAELKKIIAEKTAIIEEITTQLEGKTDAERTELEAKLAKVEEIEKQAEAKLDAIKAAARGGTGATPEYNKEKLDATIAKFEELLK